MAVSMRRSTIVNLKQVNELPLRNALESFDKNGDGKIDISELQRMLHWYGLWKHSSYGLCLVIMILIWSTFGLTIWAINLTKDYSVTNGVLASGEEVVKMSVASTYIPLNWATLLDRRHLDSLDSLTIDVKQSSGKFAAGIYHMKVASYLHANSTYLKVYGKDGSRVWVNSGTVVLYHPSADEAIMVCGASACNTLAVDVKPEYLEKLVQRSAALLQSSKDFELPSSVDGVAISKAEGEGVTCMADLGWFKGQVGDIGSLNYLGGWNLWSENDEGVLMNDVAFKPEYLGSQGVHWDQGKDVHGNIKKTDLFRLQSFDKVEQEELRHAIEVIEADQLPHDDFQASFAGTVGALNKVPVGFYKQYYLDEEKSRAQSHGYKDPALRLGLQDIRQN